MSQDLKAKLHHSAYTIISKKRDKKELSQEEINWFIDGLLDGNVEDAQVASLLMAIYLNGLTTKETAYLTDAMLYSGKVFNFNDQTVIDKHSTGGVGDKTSFILAPIAAAAGVKVPMMAGRGLGHTGGTVDKIESIKGFKTSIPEKKFKDLLLKKGLVLIGQTKEIAPADKVIYGLRDVTATIESIPLITASIMSKKLAEGASGIVMDIKCGNGAFMHNLTDAKALATSIANTGHRFKRSVMTIISNMDQPLGNEIGNASEIIESIETLKGKGPKDLTDLSVSLAGGMIYLAGLAKTHKAGIKIAEKKIQDGTALEKFRELLKNQGGDHRVIDDYSRLPKAQNTSKVLATKDGYVKEFRTNEFGLHCVSLGGGRAKSSDDVDFSVGLTVHKKIGDKVKKGDLLVSIHHHSNQKKLVTNIKKQILEKDLFISKSKPTPPSLIHEVRTKRGKKYV